MSAEETTVNEAVEPPDRLDLRSEDISADRRGELVRLLPEVATEGGNVDFEQLKRALGEHVDAGKERYGMTWPGKADCFKVIQTPSTGTLLPCPQESVNFDASENLIIEGDNLEVLKLLQKSYLGKVKLIYIDPPYNTGNDFIYPDDYTESLQTYLEYTNQVDSEGRRFSTNTDTNGRFHSQWLNMMYPRLYLARNLLSDDGVLVISIDDNEATNLRKLCDEILGEENFVSQISVQSNPRGRQSDTFVATVHDYLLVYTRLRDSGVLGGVALTEQQKAEFNLVDEDGSRYRLLGLRQRGSASRREDRPDMYFPIYVDPSNGSVSLEPSKSFSIEVLPRKSTGADGRWMWGAAKVRRDIRLVESKLIARRGEYDIFVRDHLEKSGGERKRKFKTIWDDKAFNTQNGTQEVKALLGSDAMPFPKPSALIEAVVNLGAGQDGIILDFFAGSGTTGHAVMEVNRQDGGNRRFILVQLPEPTGRDDYRTIAEICKERVRRVIDKMNADDAASLTLQEGEQPDRGFRVFKLGTSNFTTWDTGEPGSAEVLEQRLELHVDHIRDGRSDDDLLCEILLKSGFPLTTPVETLELAGKRVFIAADGALVLCLDRELTLDLVREVAQLAPERVVCLDEGFARNDQLKANAVQLFKAKGISSFKTV